MTTKPQQVAKVGATAPAKNPAASPTGAQRAAAPGQGTPGKGQPAQEQGGKATHERDARIAEAIKRVEQQAGARGGGSGSEGTGPGGPISMGPGEGVGGVVRGVEFILYKNRVESTIKEKWAWAGRQKNLRAVVAFVILESGEIANVRTVVSSGDAGYDQLAERAVRAVSPLPPPPPEYREEFANYELTFEPQEERKP